MGESSQNPFMERPLSWTDGGETDWRNLKNPCYGEIEEIEDKLQKRFRLFHNFAVIQDPPRDHRFIDNDFPDSLEKMFLMEKIVHKEWEILKCSLPSSSFFVRAYDTRPDLMRAVMIGPEGTPYSQGLFFFDIYIPSKYPSRPPEICYHYHGLEVNPYLLQVLISLHCSFFKGDDSHFPSLVLPREKSNKCDKPVFIQLCESVLEVLRHPPKGFRVLVVGHFRKQAHSILTIFKTMKKAFDPTNPENQLFKELIVAFEATGCYCRHHYTKSLELELEKYQSFEGRGAYYQHTGYMGETIEGRRSSRDPLSFKQYLMEIPQ